MIVQRFTVTGMHEMAAEITPINLERFLCLVKGQI
jgi:hypothetical protein